MTTVEIKILEVHDYSLFVNADFGRNDICIVIPYKLGNRVLKTVTKEVLCSSSGSILYFDEKVNNLFTRNQEVLITVYDNLEYQNIKLRAIYDYLVKKYYTIIR